MSFSYSGGALTWKTANLPEIHDQAVKLLAEKYSYSGAYYLYNLDVLKSRINNLISNLPGHHFYYSVKSLSNITLLREIARYDNFGLDVVSAGEIARGLQAGFTGNRMVFAGVGKTRAEIEFAIEKGIKSFHVESLAELKTISEIASGLGKTAPVALRLNPNVEVNTHKYITTGKEENKFGISESEFSNCLNFLKQSKALALIGLQAHIGSQILEVAPYEKTILFLRDAASRAEAACGCKLSYLSLGGGFGIDYQSWDTDSAKDFKLHELGSLIRNYKTAEKQIFFEPGRYISAKSGILLTTVQYMKERAGAKIAITDSGMSELLRPALYEAYHPILPLRKRSDETGIYDIVGPICESADAFALGRELSLTAENDVLAVLYAGAYGSVMGSNYNTRPLVPELILSGNTLKVIREPQQLEDILKSEIRCL